MQLSKNTKHLIYVHLVLCAGILAYANSLNCSFQFDDIKDIIENPTIREIRNIGAWMGYIPSRMVAMFTFALNYHFGGLNIVEFHLVNISIHLANAIALYSLVLFTLPLARIKKHVEELALFAALIFVAHPVQTQAVTYIVQRMTSLATLFYLISIISYLMARIKANSNRSRFIFYATSVVAAVCAMFTKQIAFTLPFVIIAFESILLRHVYPMNRSHRSVLSLVAVSIAVIIPLLYKFDFSILFRTIQPQQGHTETITAGIYLLTQFRVIMTYLRLLILPINQNLDYDYRLSHTIFEIPAFMALTGLLIILFVAFKTLRRQPLITLGVVWFLTTLSVESSIIPLPNVIFEHRLYLPSIGFVFVLIGLYNQLQFYRYPRQMLISFAAVTVVLIVLTHQRNNIWKTEFTMWDDVVKKAPANVRARTIRGKLYARAGDYQHALIDLNRAVALNPHHLNARLNRGVVYAKLNQFQPAFADFEAILKAKPNHTEARSNQANVLMAQGHYKRAIHIFDELLKNFPAKHQLYINRGSAYAQLGEYNRAIADFSRAIAIDSLSIRAYANRGIARMHQHNWDAAMCDFNKTLAISPGHVNALVNRGIIYLYARNFTRAVIDFTSAISVDANCAQAYVQRAITAYLQNKPTAMHHDLEQAQKLGLKITPKQIYQHAALITKQ